MEVNKRVFDDILEELDINITFSRSSFENWASNSAFAKVHLFMVEIEIKTPSPVREN